MPRATAKEHGDHRQRRRDASDRQVFTQEGVAKRTKRHLEELERTNYAAHEPESDGEGSSMQKSKGRARQTVISDKHGAKKKKSTMSVRTAILYRKGLAALIDESGIGSLQPSYLTVCAPPPGTPPRMLCSVCGYKGAYRCKKCGNAYCDLRCGRVHEETRCERRPV